MSKPAVASSDIEAATAPIFARRQRYPGIDRVLEVASTLVAKYTGRENLRNLGLTITRGIKRNSDSGLPDMRNADQIAGAIYKWIIRNVNYVRDPWDVERIQSPDVTLRQRAGDCDDHAILSATLLGSLGIPTGFRIVSRTGRSYDHIYCLYKTSGGWKSFDTTVAKYPGHEFDEKLIKKSKHLFHPVPTGIASPPGTAPPPKSSTRLLSLLKIITLGILTLPLMGIVASKLSGYEQ